MQLDRLERIGLFLVTHDANPNPQRSAVHWIGEPFAQTEPPNVPDDDGDPPVDDDSVPDVDPPTPPDCSEQVRAARAADVAVLDAIEDRLREQVIEPFGRLGLWGKLTQGPALLRKAEQIIADDYRTLVDEMRGGPR